MNYLFLLLLLAKYTLTNDSQIAPSQSKIPKLSDLILNSCIDQIKENPSDKENKKMLLWLQENIPNKWLALKKEFFEWRTEERFGNTSCSCMRWSFNSSCFVNSYQKPGLNERKNLYHFDYTTYYANSGEDCEWINRSYNENHFTGIYVNPQKQQQVLAYKKSDREYDFALPTAIRIKCSKLNKNIFYVSTNPNGIPHLEKRDYDQKCNCLISSPLPNVAKPELFRFYETANTLKYVLLHSTFGIWEFNTQDFKVGKQLPFKAMRCKTNTAGTLIVFSNILAPETVMLGDIWICSSDNLETPLHKIEFSALVTPKSMRFICYDKYFIVGIDKPLFGKVKVFSVDTGESFFESKDEEINDNPINIFTQSNSEVYIRNGCKGWYSLKFPLLLAYAQAKQESTGSNLVFNSNQNA